jgi:hypothetical protein
MVNYLTAARITAAKTTEAPRFYSASGYGRKIPTSRMVRLDGKRWHRVYVCQISNAGTAYVVTKDDDFLVIGPEAEERIDQLA